MGRGGKRPGAGRKSKATEQSLIERLTPLEDMAFEELEKAVKRGEKWAIQMFMAYRYGKPIQTTAHTLDVEKVNIPPIHWVK